MMLRVSFAAVLMFGGSITAALAADETALAPVQVKPELSAAATAALPRFEPSRAVGETGTGFVSVPVVQAVPETIAADPVEPAEDAARDLGSGVASWYGARFAGRKTASGERFDPSELTAAHRTLPFGSRVKVTRGERSVIVRINDRGPFHGNRVIDLSRAAADRIGLVHAGRGEVELSLLD